MDGWILVCPYITVLVNSQITAANRLQTPTLWLAKIKDTMGAKVMSLMWS